MRGGSGPRLDTDLELRRPVGVEVEVGEDQPERLLSAGLERTGLVAAGGDADDPVVRVEQDDGDPDAPRLLADVGQRDIHVGHAAGPGILTAGGGGQRETHRVDPQFVDVLETQAQGLALLEFVGLGNQIGRCGHRQGQGEQQDGKGGESHGHPLQIQKKDPSQYRRHRSASRPAPTAATGPGPGFAAALLAQFDLLDRDAAVDRLGHVVQGEATRADRDQRLHLDAGGPAGPRRRGDDRGATVVVELDLDLDVVQRNAVAQRNPVRGPLRRLDPGDPGQGDRVALGQPVVAKLPEGRSVEQHPARGDGQPLRRPLAADIDHPRPAGGVEVGHLGHRRVPSPRRRSALHRGQALKYGEALFRAGGYTNVRESGPAGAQGALDPFRRHLPCPPPVEAGGADRRLGSRPRRAARARGPLRQRRQPGPRRARDSRSRARAGRRAPEPSRHGLREAPRSVPRLHPGPDSDPGRRRVGSCQRDDPRRRQRHRRRRGAGDRHRPVGRARTAGAAVHHRRGDRPDRGDPARRVDDQGTHPAQPRLRGGRRAVRRLCRRRRLHVDGEDAVRRSHRRLPRVPSRTRRLARRTFGDGDRRHPGKRDQVPGPPDRRGAGRRYSRRGRRAERRLEAQRDPPGRRGVALPA